MKICVNYSIDKLLKKYEDGCRDAETTFLMNVVEQYRKDTEMQILQYMNEFSDNYPKGNVEDFMAWVELNVDAEYRKYVRCKYLGISYDVLKKNTQKYKTLKQIGIEIDTSLESKGKEWLLQWEKYIERIEKLSSVFETHWHPNLDQYKTKLDEVMQLIQSAGIYKSIVPSVEAFKRDEMGNLINVNLAMLHMLEKYDNIYFAFASHPKYIWKEPYWGDERWAEMERMVKNNRCVAVGETGLDYSYSGFCKEHQVIQELFFSRFISIANKYKLPVILHLRPRKDVGISAFSKVNEDALRILEKNPIQYGAVYHCFGGDENVMKKYLQKGVTYFGIGGRILNDEHELINAIRNMPIESILLETDAPYINTHPELYGPNTPLLLYSIAKKVGEIRGITADRIISISNTNAERLFKTKRLKLMS